MTAFITKFYKTNSTTLKRSTSARAGVSLLAVSALAPLFLSAISSSADAATIGLRTEDSIEIESADDSFHVGDMYYAVDSEGIRRAIIEITSVQPPDAKAKLLKGDTLPGETLILRPRQSSTRHFADRVPRKFAPAASDAPEAFKNEKLWHWGLGISYFTLNGNVGGGNSVDYNTGLAANISRSFRIDHHFALDFGFLYYHAGAQATSAGGNLTVGLDYIGFLSSANWTFADFNDSQIRLKGGLMGSGLLKSTSSFSSSFGGSSTNTNVVNSKDDIGIVVGLEYMTLPGGWWIDLLADYGLLNIANASAASAVSNSGFLVMAGGSF